MMFEGELRKKVLAILAEALEEERYPEAVAELTLEKIEKAVADHGWTGFW